MVMRVVVNTLALLAVFFLVWSIPGNLNTVLTALVMAIILAVINSFLRPILLLLTLPVTLLTMGLFAIVVNAFCFFLAARLVEIPVGFGRAFLGYLVFVLVSFALNRLTLRRR